MRSKNKKKAVIRTASHSSVDSQRSKRSQRSIGMGPTLRMASSDIKELTKETQTISTSRLTPEGGLPSGETVFHCIAYIVRCQHDRVAISCVDKSNAIWLPFVAFPSTKTWMSASIDGISTIFCKRDAELDAKLATRIPIKHNICLHVLRFQTPQKKKFITRLTQYVLLDKNTDKFKCCQNTRRIKWFPISDAINNKIENVWGPEVCRFAKHAKQSQSLGIEEFSLENAYHYVSEDKPKNSEEIMLRQINIGEKEVEILYSDYIEHCFPAFYMTIDSFKDYMVKTRVYEPNDPKLPLIFKAFCLSKQDFIGFNELLLGLAAMEKETDNSEARIKFVFRYYDTDRDGFLSQTEFEALIKDISTLKDDKVVKSKANEVLKLINVKDNKIGFNDFTKAINEKKIKGISDLCRASKSVLKQISESIKKRSDYRTNAKQKASFLTQHRKGRGKCEGCKAKKYEYGIHSVKLDTNGRCVEPRRIIEPDTISDHMTQQQYSMEFVFDTKSIGNILIDLIRGFRGSNKKEKVNIPNGFMSGGSDRAVLFNYFENLCLNLTEIFTFEDRVIKINSPVYVIGDIYGNLDDVFVMERLLWQQFPIISANYVFLGNYVDKGKWSIETIVYLLALKLIKPNKIIMLRGSHETREAQTENTFQNELTQKYGKGLGIKIWAKINDLFDKMPLSVIIDESIFCSNSGIPKSNLKIDAIQKISNDLKNPKQSAIVWELMNSNPSTESDKTHFNENDLKAFLQTNGFSHIIVGNQLTKDGFGIHFGGKCLSLFSCSHFCGQSNQKAVIFVDSDRIRIIRL